MRVSVSIRSIAWYYSDFGVQIVFATDMQSLFDNLVSFGAESAAHT
jgi:hypothetical protein